MCYVLNFKFLVLKLFVWVVMVLKLGFEIRNNVEEILM